MLDRLKPMQQMALLGVLSGILTTFVKIEALVIGDVSVLPGIFFGLVLAYGLYRWDTQQPLKLIGTVLLVIVAWYAAYFSCIMLHEPVKKTLSIGGAPLFAVLGLIGGFIGSIITARTIHLFSPAFRERNMWVRVVVFGTVAGALLALPEMGFDYGTASLLPLFVLWQAGVASMVARGITGLK